MSLKEFGESDLVTGDLRNKTALITGASRGIGLATAKAFAGLGCNLVITARNLDSTKFAVQELAAFKTKILSYACDVRSEAEIDNLAKTVKAEFGSIDILFNNAGVAHPLTKIENFPTDQWRRNLETNLTGTFLVTRALLPLIPAGGSIVNNISVAAYTVFPELSAYMASKAGALAFTNALREELREKKIRVMALVVGATNTDIWDELRPDAPRGRMMDPADIASSIVNALQMPLVTSVEEIRIRPSVGSL